MTIISYLCRGGVCDIAYIYTKRDYYVKINVMRIPSVAKWNTSVYYIYFYQTAIQR